MPTPIIFLIEAIKTKRALNPYLYESSISLHWWESSCAALPVHDPSILLSHPSSGEKVYILPIDRIIILFNIGNTGNGYKRLLKGLPWCKIKKKIGSPSVCRLFSFHVRFSGCLPRDDSQKAFFLKKGSLWIIFRSRGKFF